MVKAPILLFALLLILAIPQAAIAQSPTANGEINGSLINGTSGGGSVENLEVKLAVYENNTEKDGRSTQSSGNGKFTFTAVPTDSAYTYQVQVVYKEVEYRSPVFGFEAGKTTQSIELEVFETTTESVPVSAMLAHAILDYADGLIVVKEYYYFVNGSDRTYIGQVVDSTTGRRETLKLSLPAGDTQAQSFYGLSESLVQSGSDISFSAPLFPGTNEVIYLYSLPCDSDRYTLSWDVRYNINRFDLLIANESIQTSSEQLNKEQSLNIGGKVYQDYSGSNLVAGDKISIKFSGLQGKGNSNLAALAWLAVIPVGAMVALVILRRRKKFRAVMVANTNDPERQRLLAEIAELDDRYEDGSISEEEYKRLRSEKKGQLLKG